MTKFDQLKAYCLSRKSFKFSHVNIYFGHKTTSLNSYTTYLNYLVRAGYLEKNDHVYSVPDRDRLKNAELADILVRNKLKRAINDYKALEESNEYLREHRAELALEIGNLKAEIERQRVIIDTQKNSIDMWSKNYSSATQRANSLDIDNKMLSQALHVLENTWHNRFVRTISRYAKKLTSLYA